MTCDICKRTIRPDERRLIRPRVFTHRAKYTISLKVTVLTLGRKGLTQEKANVCPRCLEALNQTVVRLSNPDHVEVRS